MPLRFREFGHVTKEMDARHEVFHDPFAADALTVGRELPENLPDGGAAHAVGFAKLALDHPLPGRERLLDDRQDPLLVRASELFSTLTLGRYSALRVEVGDAAPRLLGIRAWNSFRLLNCGQRFIRTGMEIVMPLIEKRLSAWNERFEPG